MRSHLRLLVAATCAIVFAITTPSLAVQSETELISTHFTSPTGNIDCQMFSLEGTPGTVDVSAECRVDNATWKNPPKEPADCGLDFDPFEIGLDSETKGAKVTTSVTVGGCRGDIGPTCATGDCYTLKYGDSRRVGNVRCTSLKTGVTCVSLTGKKRGFTAARAKYTIIK
jgi:hypothetical protein